MTKTVAAATAALMILTGAARAQPTQPGYAPGFKCYSPYGALVTCPNPATSPARPAIPGVTYDANGWPIISVPAPWQLYITCMRHMQEEGGWMELTDPAEHKAGFDHAAAFCSVSSFGH